MCPPAVPQIAHCDRAYNKIGHRGFPDHRGDLDSYFLWAVHLVLFTRHARAYWAKKLPKLLACHLQDSGVLEREGSGWRAFLGELPWSTAQGDRE